MTEAEWLTTDEVPAMLRHVAPTASDRKNRLYLCAGCRLIARELYDPASLAAVEAGERLADGRATPGEVEAAHDAWGAALYMYDFSGDLNAGTHLAGECLQPNPLWDGTFGLIRKVRWPGRWLVDCVYGNPFRPVAPNDTWLSPTAVAVAHAIYDNKTFHDLPILADALEDAGCDSPELLAHCRADTDHARGCWAVDLVLKPR